MKVVVIDWVDSVRAFDWTLMEDVDEKSLDCISVGFLLKDTDNCVTIAQNYGIKPEQVCNLITIPKCSIRNIRELTSQNEWKPSEGQLECLGYAIDKAEKDWSPLTNNRIYLTLKVLKEQLLELRGSKV